MPECPRCGLKFQNPVPTPLERCPSCDFERPHEPATSESSTSLITRYLDTVWQLLTRPSSFFARMPLKGGVSGPLAFALVTQWIGHALGFLWLSLIGGKVMEYFEGWERIPGEISEIDNPGRATQWLETTDRLTEWFRSAAPVIADPFLTLFSALFASALVYTGARIFVTPGKNGAPREITFESALRIVCYGMAPAILAGLPIFGFGLASFLSMVVTVIGAKVVYRTGVIRAIAIALFPKLLFVAILFGGLFLLMIALAKFLASLL